MTKEYAYTYDAGYRDGSTNYELEHCPACKNVADLQEALAENAKLRELATLNWEWARSCCGNNCRMQTDVCGYGIDRDCNYEREVYERMRALGIEVDE